jgi:homeobox-leucine zipper protein
MGGDGIEDVVVACNSTKKIRNNSNVGIAFGALGCIICAKASMLLQVTVITML